MSEFGVAIEEFLTFGPSEGVFLNSAEVATLQQAIRNLEGNFANAQKAWEHHRDQLFAALQAKKRSEKGTLHYRSWEIRRDSLGAVWAPQSATYIASHESYDGPEDNRCFHEGTIEACMERIDDWHEEQEERQARSTESYGEEVNGPQELAHQMELARRVK